MAPRYRNVEAAHVRNQLAQTQRRQDHRPPHWEASKVRSPESQWPRMIYHKLSTITYHNLSKLACGCLSQKYFFPCFFFCFFHSTLFVFFSFSWFFIFFIFLFFQFTVNKWDEVLFRHDSRSSCFNERGAATPWQTDTSKRVWRLPELVDTMQHVVRVEQRTAMCQSMCSEPLSNTSAMTRMFTVLLSGRFCLQNLLGSRWSL